MVTTGIFAFTVNCLGIAPGGTITVDFQTSGGTALQGIDYEAVSGTLTFDSANTRRTITVPVHNDSLEEDDETFFLQLLSVAEVRESYPPLTVLHRPCARLC